MNRREFLKAFSGAAIGASLQPWKRPTYRIAQGIAPSNICIVYPRYIESVTWTVRSSQCWPSATVEMKILINDQWQDIPDWPIPLITSVKCKDDNF